MILTPRVRAVLTLMRDRTDADPSDEDAELVEAIPGGWYLGNERVGGQVGWFLLRRVLISASSDATPSFTRYHINEWGRRALDDPTFVPDWR